MAKGQFTCRWAALSLSSIAAVFLPDVLLPRDPSEPIRHELVAVSTTGSPEKATNWLKENHIDASSIKIYLSWDEMLEKGDFDAVYISTPHPLHYQHTLKAIECRRSVLVEKPATMNRKQYEMLAKKATENGVLLMEAMWTRYLPATRFLKEDLLPRIGDVKRVYADFSFPIVSPDLPKSSRFLDKQAGAGSLLDQGVYALTWVDIALNGIDSSAVTDVAHASSMSVPGVSGEVDDINTVVIAKHAKGADRHSAIAIVTTSMTLPGSSKPSFYQRLQAQKAAPSVRIEGTKASVAIPFPPIRPQELHVQWYDEDHINEQGIEADEIIKKPVKRGWGIWYQADVFAEQLAKTKQGQNLGSQVIGVEESLRVLDWMDQARKRAGIQYDAELDRL